MTKKGVLFSLIFVLGFALSACERTATTSSWSAINESQTQSTPSLIATLAKATSTSTPKFTPTSKFTPTRVAVATLDLSTLATKYPLAFKGYELLTWQKDGEWVFTLLTGTNRQKSFDEILAAGNTFSSTEINKVTVIGVEDFKKLLDHLPKGEWITWGGMDLAGEIPAGTVYFSYPPDDIFNDVIDYCKQKGITLMS